MTIELTSDDLEYFSELYARYSKYSKPTNIQKLITTLFEKQDKTKEDVKNIKQLIKAEKLAQRNFQAQQKINKLLREEKNEERKKIERKKFVLGGAFYNALTSNMRFNDSISYEQIFEKMLKDGLIGERDKDCLKEFIKTPQNVTNPSF